MTWTEYHAASSRMVPCGELQVDRSDVVPVGNSPVVYTDGQRCIINPSVEWDARRYIVFDAEGAQQFVEAVRSENLCYIGGILYEPNGVQGAVLRDTSGACERYSLLSPTMRLVARSVAQWAGIDCPPYGGAD
jgi:hypothetical protein